MTIVFVDSTYSTEIKQRFDPLEQKKPRFNPHEQKNTKKLVSIEQNWFLYHWDYVGNLQGEVNDGNSKTHEDDSFFSVLFATCHCGFVQVLYYQLLILLWIALAIYLVGENMFFLFFFLSNLYFDVTLSFFYLTQSCSLLKTHDFCAFILLFSYNFKSVRRLNPIV